MFHETVEKDKHRTKSIQTTQRLIGWLVDWLIDWLIENLAFYVNPLCSVTLSKWKPISNFLASGIQLLTGCWLYDSTIFWQKPGLKVVEPWIRFLSCHVRWTPENFEVPQNFLNESLAPCHPKKLPMWVYLCLGHTWEIICCTKFLSKIWRSNFRKFEGQKRLT